MPAQVWELPWSEIRQLRWPGDEDVPLVADVLAAVAPHFRHVTLDVKPKERQVQQAAISPSVLSFIGGCYRRGPLQCSRECSGVDCPAFNPSPASIGRLEGDNICLESRRHTCRSAVVPATRAASGCGGNCTAGGGAAADLWSLRAVPWGMCCSCINRLHPCCREGSQLMRGGLPGWWLRCYRVCTARTASCGASPTAW